MHIGEFQREVEYLDPGLPVEQELVESSKVTEDNTPQHAAPVKV